MTHQSGIYQIRNLKNGKRYIGSAVTIRTRWNEHRHELRHQCHHSPKLQNSWNKNGEDIFAFEVLLYCDSEHCLMYEQIALDHFKPAYNIQQIAKSPLGTKRTHAQKRRMSKAHFGIKHKDQAKKKLMDQRIGELNPSARITKQIVVQIRQMYRNGITQTAIAPVVGLSRQQVNRICNSKRWSHV